MKSIQKNIKWMLPVGIVISIVGLIMIFTSILNYGSETTGNFTHIGGEDGGITIVSNIDWGSIVGIIAGFIYTAVGVCLVVFNVFGKKDFIEANEDFVKCHCNMKDFTIRYDEIESIKSSFIGIRIQRKNEKNNLPILFIKNSYEIAKFIGDRIVK